MRLGLGLGMGMSSVPWTPRRLGSAVTLWLRADAGVTLNGATVSAWADQSGSGHHFTQGTALNQPTYNATGGPSGGPSIDFGGSHFLTNALTPTAFVSVSAYEFWAAAYFTTLTLGSTFNNDHVVIGNPSGWVGFAGATSGMLMGHDDGANKAATRSGLSAGAWVRARGWFSGGTISCALNGGAAATQAAGNLGGSTGVMQVGKGGGALNGRMSEIVVCNRALTAGEATSLAAYFARRGT